MSQQITEQDKSTLITNLDTYRLLDTIAHNQSTIIHRAIRDSDGEAVMLKIPVDISDLNNIHNTFKNEYETIKKIEHPGVIKAASLESASDRPILVLEESRGLPLSQYQGKQIDYPDFFEITAQLAEILGNIHAKGITHKDIKPSNILREPNGRIKLIDFGLSTTLTKEKTDYMNINILEGTLRYISPEQTGRMNRSLDYRSDLYSLGVLLYELIVGAPPFSAKTPLEQVHAHIAITPDPPAKLRPETPKPISDIIMKLLSKMAEQRYQNAFTLKDDIEKCRRQWESHKKIEEFPIAENDAPMLFQVSQKLYAREKEIEILLRLFDLAANGPAELLLISGDAGLGKTALVSEIHQPVMKNRGYFISGKYDQFEQNIPYSSIIQAFRNLVSQILTESDESVQKWRDRINAALGENGKVITDVIPEVEYLIGPQSPIPELTHSAAQRRFQTLFSRFIGSLTQKENPLVIFLDDLQWADLPSMRLIRSILEEQTQKHLMIIGAYRDREIEKTHILHDIIDELERSEGRIHRLQLTPLDLESARQMAADSFGVNLQNANSEMGADKIEELAALVIRKTAGNPFFSREFLKTLYEKEIIYYNAATRNWDFKLKAIERANITNNVVELLVETLEKLPVETQTILQYGACIGNEFRLSTLAKICNQPRSYCAEKIWSAIEMGLINTYGQTARNIKKADETKLRYSFSHDRVQQAAYSMISYEYKKEIHLEIGRILAGSLTKSSPQKNKFEATNHYTIGAELINDPKEKLEFIELCVEASRQARAQSAYEPSYRYARNAGGMLPEEAWREQHQICIKAHLELLISTYLIGRYAEIEAAAHKLLKHAKSQIDIIQVYEILIQTHMGRHDFKKAYMTAVEGLNKFGVSIPAKANNLKVMAQIIGLKAYMAFKGVSDNKKGIEKLENLPELTDPLRLRIMQLMMHAWSASYIYSQLTIPILGSKLVKMSIQYGNASYSSYGYSVYGMLMCSGFKKYDFGRELAHLSERLVDRFSAHELIAKTTLLNTAMILNWTQPLKELLPKLKEGYRTGLRVGDFEYTGYCTNVYSEYTILSGFNLEKVEAELKRAATVLESVKQNLLLNLNKIKSYLVFALRNHPEKRGNFQYDIEAIEKGLLEKKDNMSLGQLYIYNMIIGVVYQDIEPAYENMLKCRKIIQALAGTIFIPLFYFYESLILAYRHILPAKRNGHKRDPKALRKIEANKKKMAAWAEVGPENYSHKLKIMEALIAAAHNNEPDFISAINEALRLAARSAYIYEEAMAHEIAFQYFEERGRQGEPKEGRHFYSKSHFNQMSDLYSKWGAAGKIEVLKMKHPGWFHAAPLGEGQTFRETLTGASSDRKVSQILDLSTIIKASETIAGEIRHNELLKKMVSLAIENVAAQKGYLLLEEEGEWRLIIIAEPNNVTFAEEIPVAEADTISHGIFNYVLRTKKYVYLNNASLEGNFTQDPYVLKHRPKSVLCMPFIHQERVVGIIYMENNLSSNAFTPERFETLNLLSSQIAISIENTRFYERLKKLNDAYVRFVPEQFLSLLKKKSITDVQLGDQAQKVMTVLFMDIRDFTAISETMTPQQNFHFINSFLGIMEPVIDRHEGFIDKYMGDAIMALFPDKPDRAIECALEMLKELKRFNEINSGREAVRIGIGINTGSLMIGTVGGYNRMDTTVISDSVNVASRIESLTKEFKEPLLISEDTRNSLAAPERYDCKKIGDVKVKGKAKNIGIYRINKAGTDI